MHGMLSAVIIVLALNAASLLVTFERTMWVATAIGVAVVLLRAKPTGRMKGVTWVVVISLASLAGNCRVRRNGAAQQRQRHRRAIDTFHHAVRTPVSDCGLAALTA